MRSRALRLLVPVALSVLGGWAFGQSAEGSLPVVPADLKSRRTIENPTPYFTNPTPRRFVIWWNDTPGIDGDFNFVVHPGQVFLVSSHNNPNPNFVYWVCGIDKDQYTALVARLERGAPVGLAAETQLQMPGYTLFKLRAPVESPWMKANNPTPEQWRAWGLRSDAAVNKNLSRIVATLNRELGETHVITCKSEIEEQSGRLRVEEAP